jgi:hypothetical protein
LSESLLAKVKNPRPAKYGWTAVMERKVIDVAAMKRETDCLFLAVSNRFSGWLVSLDSDQRNSAWCR